MFSVSNLLSIDHILLKLGTLYLLQLYTELYIKSLFYLMTLSSFFNLLFRASPTGEYSNLACSTTPGLYPKSSSVKYSYLFNCLDDNAEGLDVSLSKSY